MSVLSVPLPPDLEQAINNLLKWGVASNRADAARKAILKLEEDTAIQVVLESEQAALEGKLISGNLRGFIKKSSTKK
jgi:Arc/MetJ-type ribon-helix-helix transcriptional regulator